MIKKLSFIFLSLLYAMNLSAEYCFPNDLTADQNISFVGSNQLNIEPQFAYAKFNLLEKEAGWLWGIKGRYDFISLGLPYFGLESAYMQGDLKKGDGIKTDYQDFFIEVKLGYPVGQLGIRLVPFVGLAYETEDFHSLALELKSVKDKIHYGYVSFGFLSRWLSYSGISIGLDFKAKYLFLANYKSKAEVNHNCTLSNCFHYTLELPLMWQASSQFEAGFVPLYEYKTYCLNLADLEWIDKIKIQEFGLQFRLNYLF